MTILELILSLALGSLILIGSTASLSYSILEQLSATATLSQLRLSQYLSFSTQTDTLIHYTEHDIHIEKQHIQFPTKIRINGNREQFGFKANLNTPYAGSLTLSTANSNYRITFPVGICIPKLYKKSL